MYTVYGILNLLHHTCSSPTKTLPDESDTRNLQTRPVLTKYFNVKTTTRNVESEPSVTTEPLRPGNSPSPRISLSVCCYYYICCCCEVLQYYSISRVLCLNVMSEYFYLHIAGDRGREADKQLLTLLRVISLSYNPVTTGISCTRTRLLRVRTED